MLSLDFSMTMLPEKRKRLGGEGEEQAGGVAGLK